MNKADVDRISAEGKKSGFEIWLNEPMVRMGISMIPQADKAEALRMLLQSAFEAGYGKGAGDVAVSLVAAILKKDTDRQ